MSRLNQLRRNLQSLQGYEAELRKLKRTKIAVGLIESTAGSRVYPNGISVVQVGAIHEFGAGAIPQRSFLRAPFDIKKEEINNQIRTGIENVQEGRSTAERELNRAGTLAVNICKNAFPTSGYGTWEPLSQETIDRKGSSLPLKDTGLLNGSIAYEVKTQ